jgi:hypothetical protein
MENSSSFIDWLKFTPTRKTPRTRKWQGEENTLPPEGKDKQLCPMRGSQVSQLICMDATSKYHALIFLEHRTPLIIPSLLFKIHFCVVFEGMKH